MHSYPESTIQFLFKMQGLAISLGIIAAVSAIDIRLRN